MIGRPYVWQCEAERCLRQRDKRGRLRPHGRDIDTVDRGPGHRFHPECDPQPTLGLITERTR